MFRRACLAALVVALLTPALPALADDGDWGLPDVGAWFLSLFDLDSVTIEVAKSDQGGSGDPPADPGGDDDGSDPGQESGMFIDPNG